MTTAASSGLDLFARRVRHSVVKILLSMGRAVLVAGLLFSAGCASIDPWGPQPLQGAVDSAVLGHGNVNVTLHADGTAIVRGWVEDRMSAWSVLRTVAARAEVTSVVDRIDVGRLLF